MDMAFARTGQTEYKVERIVGWRQGDKAAESEANWEGHAEADNTWELYINLTRFGSGRRALSKEYVDSTDQHLRQLLPRAYGGTDVLRRGR